MHHFSISLPTWTIFVGQCARNENLVSNWRVNGWFLSLLVTIWSTSFRLLVPARIFLLFFYLVSQPFPNHFAKLNTVVVVSCVKNSHNKMFLDFNESTKCFLKLGSEIFLSFLTNYFLILSIFDENFYKI